MQIRSKPPNNAIRSIKVLTDSFTYQRAGKMKRFTAEDVSSDEEQDSDDERLYFEERLDPAEDIISEENVAASLLSSPAPAATLSPSFDARTGARSNENNKENVAATRSPLSDTRTRARSNASDIHPVNVAATRSPSSDTRMRAHSNATGNKKEIVSASPLPLPSPATHTRRTVGLFQFSKQLRLMCVQLNRNCFEQWHDDI